MIKIILRSYKSGSQEKGYNTGSNVFQRMNKNPLFADEQPTIEVLKASKEVLDAAKGEALNGDKVKIAIKNECHKKFIAQLDNVADAIEAKANGDVKIAQDAGFETVSTTRRSIDFLKMPTGLKAEDVKGRKGYIKVGWDRDSDSVMTIAQFQVVGEADAPWQEGATCTASSTLVSGLPSGKYVAVRIYSTGRKGLKSDTTDPVIVLVS